MPLIERDDSILIVVDAQPGFSGGIGDEGSAAGRARAVATWLVGVAATLDVPIVVTEEDAARNGPTDPGIVANLRPGTPIFAKPVFGLADVPAILAAVEASGRRTAVLVGAETCSAPSRARAHDQSSPSERFAPWPRRPAPGRAPARRRD
jgi:nicotinamidase-related amidase